MRRNKGLLILLTLLASTSLLLYRLTMPGALILIRFMDWTEQAVRDGKPFKTHETVIENNGRRIPVRVYRPRSDSGSTLLLVHGVHFDGYDEPRLIHFAKRLAGLGHVVVTPDIEDLRNYNISRGALKDISMSAEWILDDGVLPRRRQEDRIGIMGISFAGGLCLSIAGMPGIRERTRFVFSFGGHGDLGSTMRYLVTGELEDGSALEPHIYGQAVLVRRFADSLVSEEGALPLRGAIMQYLRGEYDLLRNRIDEYPPDVKHLLNLCLDRKTRELRRILKPIVLSASFPDVLSPLRGNPPPAPVFLLHGSADNVIPPTETLAVERWASPSTHTRALVSELITHVEIEQKKGRSSSWLEYWRIIRFWTELLRS